MSKLFSDLGNQDFQFAIIIKKSYVVDNVDPYVSKFHPWSDDMSNFPRNDLQFSSNLLQLNKLRSWQNLGDWKEAVQDTHLTNFFMRS